MVDKAKERDKTREYKPSHIKRLFALSGNQCAEPSCTRPLIAKDGESIIGKICHIEAASSDGPRWNPDMSDEDRRNFKNLILLCDEDHTIIDKKENEAKYSVILLKEWKTNHESKLLGEKLRAKPSLLKDAINSISNMEWEGVKENESLTSYNLKEKITYNSVKEYLPLITEYKRYHGKINSLYDEIEKQGSFKKEKLLRNIRNIYVEVKRHYILDAENEIEIIRINADKIIDDVISEIYDKLVGIELYEEDIGFAINLVIVDAFMRCKILEEPI